MEVLAASLYDFPKYYDLLFGSDWKAEFDFLRACFDRHARRPVRRAFEPACGTGRLMVKLAQAGLRVSGCDLNPKAVAFCNARLARYGFPKAARVCDMADFQLRKPVDAAFNMINSFRHLASEEAAENHLRCVAAALAPGGLYVLGFHLTPTKGVADKEESWSARRGNLAVLSRLETIRCDLRRRQEMVKMTLDVYTPRRQFRLIDDMAFRTYTAAQFRTLLGRVHSLELAETYDFAYEIDNPVPVDAYSQDVVYVLRRR
jgi:SAM-dependent methyltransferase